MISIGDFARQGRVSVRMLRHYDTLGLLRLNRIVALKDLGLRLEQVRARLRLIDAEETMTDPDAITKTVPAATVAGLTGTAVSATQEDVGPVVVPMYPVIMQRLAAAGVWPTGPSIAYYTPAPDQGFTGTGCAREVYLECPDDPADWITEIQVEFTR